MLGDLVAKQRSRRLCETDIDPAARANGRAREQRGCDGLKMRKPGRNIRNRCANLCGVLSLPTLTDTRPENACATESEPGRFEYGPSCPKPLTER